MAYSYGQLEQLWISSGGNSAIAPVMAAIALAESGGNPTAENVNNNGTIDRGLWQVNSSNNPSTAMFNPSANAQEAVRIYNSQGLQAWTTYNTGAYKRFLNGASVPQSATLTAATSDSLGLGGLLGIPSQITGFFSDADTLIHALMWLAQPSSWIRIGAFIAGVALLLFAIHAFLAVGEGGNIFPSAPAVIPVTV